MIHNERESEDNVYHCLEEGDPAHAAAETGKTRMVSYVSGRPSHDVLTIHQVRRRCVNNLRPDMSLLIIRGVWEEEFRI